MLAALVEERNNQEPVNMAARHTHLCRERERERERKREEGGWRGEPSLATKP